MRLLNHVRGCLRASEVGFAGYGGQVRVGNFIPGASRLGLCSVPMNRKMIHPVVDKTFTECLEQLQEAYVLAVAATAGCLVEIKRRDRYGADIEIIQQDPTGGEELTIGAQLKCTTRITPDASVVDFPFQFSRREHLEELTKARGRVKKILLVMATHPVQSTWTTASHEEMWIQRSCYWANIEGDDIAEGVKKPSVRVSTANRFDAPELLRMFTRLGKGLRL